MELVLSEFGAALRKTGARLVVRRRDKPDFEVPAEDVTGITVTGKGVSLSSDAIEAAAAQGASIAFVDFAGHPVALLCPPEAWRHAALRRAQLRAADDARGLALCRAFLRGKLHNQARNLLYFAKSRKESAPQVHAGLHAAAHAIRVLADEIDALPGGSAPSVREAMMNREAQAAKAYWGGVARILPDDVNYPGRVRMGAKDPVNISLNYGYGLLYGHVWRALLTSGLDPYAGFLHADQDGKPTLVFDYIEEFRPYAVDRPVLGLLTRRWRPSFQEDELLDDRSRRDLAGRVMEQLETPVECRGKHHRLADVIALGAYEIAASVRGEKNHEPFLADW